ncbi:hypothetical protein [Bartonella choladocola]|uniref:Uncharacterized protein n=1 Tax=Bartonella choladocola TaxID=2750995 RepID=A0A1U9MJH2_9HYPH|nr:hypothetical protein [Bartonella choladocola]AQT47873.1 hypothetical protein BBC0122_017740 [Bartonella choladocola]
MVGTKKLTPPETAKSVKKTVVKKVHQQKRAAPLTEKIEKETVQDSDGFEEKAARSRVTREKEIERQVLGNEGMAARSSVEFKKETLENVLESKEKAARSRVKREKEVLQQVLGNDKLTAHSSGAVETKTVQDEDDAKGKLPLESNAVLKTKPTEKSLTKEAAQKKREAVGEKKASGILKEAILKAAIKAGNQLGEDGLVSYLEAQALKNASSFLTLLGKVLPAELNSEGQELKTVTKIELVALSPSPKDLTVAKSPTGKKRMTSKKHIAGNQKKES